MEKFDGYDYIENNGLKFISRL